MIDENTNYHRTSSLMTGSILYCCSTFTIE
jgi:hypothetical protein